MIGRKFWTVKFSNFVKSILKEFAKRFLLREMFYQSLDKISIFDENFNF